jgi:hypothetical protein
MAVLCVRNTCIEDIHAGIEPHSPAGDFSDVKAVTPAGEIPWSRLSRMRNDEMREFMKRVVDRLYTDCCDWMIPNSSRAWINMPAGRPVRGTSRKTCPIGSSKMPNCRRGGARYSMIRHRLV